MKKIVDVTSKVEVMEGIEEKYGIEVSGIYCSLDLESRFNRRFDSEFRVECNGEIKGLELKENVLVKAVSYDEKGRVLGDSDMRFSEELFSGYDTFTLCIRTNIRPSKFKILILKD